MSNWGWIFGLLFSFSTAAKADTMLDGYWEMKPGMGLSCLDDTTPNPDHVAEYFDKYQTLHLHLSDLQLVKYWVTPEGQSIVSPGFLLYEIESNVRYLLKHMPLSIPDAELILINDQQNSYLEYRTLDHEWNLCRGTAYQVFFQYLRLNP